MAGSGVFTCGDAHAIPLKNPRFVTDWEPYHLKETTLHEVEARLAREPEVITLQFERARLLAQLGRSRQAMHAYADILLKRPNDFASLINLGAVLTDLAQYQDALKLYREVVQRFPDNPAGHLNLACVLSVLGETTEARAGYETVLRLDPDHSDAHHWLSDLLMESGEEDASFAHRRAATAKQPWRTSPFRGKKEPVFIMLLGSARGGNAPIQRYLGEKDFFTSVTYTDFYTPSLPLPRHQVVINLIGDADRSADSLQTADLLLERTSAPVLNPPARVRPTGRDDNARRLGKLEGVITPRILTLPREVLINADASSVLKQHDFAFPILLRAPGFHGGAHFSKVENPGELASAASQLPGKELTVIQFLETRDADGKIRKYRVMLIDGKLYPLHKAISDHWKVHYFSAQMADNPEHRAEELAFLEDMPGVLGPRAMQALEQIRDTLALDYAGVDFSLNAQGEVLLFEANATMMAALPEGGAKWDYRRPAAKRIHDAVREMIRSRAGVAA